MPWNRSFIVRLVVPYAATTCLLAYLGESSWRAAAITSTVGILAATWFATMLLRRIARLTDLSHAIVEERDPPPLQAQQDAFGGLERNLVGMSRALRARLASVREEKSKLQAVLGGMVEGVLVVDPNGRIQMTNERAQRIFGATAQDPLVGKMLLHVARDPELADLLRALDAGPSEEPIKRELTRRRGDRDEFYQITATQIPAHEGDPRLFILVLHDVTELKRLEATRRDFVGNVSHEIRTPLTAVRGYAETLRSGAINDPEQADKFLQVIERHSERLSRLTDDLLALSDLELGRAALRRESVSLGQVVDTSLELVREKADHGRVKVRREIPVNLPAFVADPDRMVQILVNLVDNAVKYTEAGGEVVVSARTFEGKPPTDNRFLEAGPWIEISVRDTGIGIPSRDLPRLTERFYRVDKARARALGGTGLGLAIVKHIVQAHGGAMLIESELGRGTNVRIFLPRGPIDTDATSGDTAVA